MAAFDWVRFDAFCKGVAGGLTVIAAARAAGYPRTPSSCYRHKQREDFAPTVERWKLELQRGGSADLGPVINDLMAGAETAMALGTGVGMMAAARMLAEAGRLKQKLPKARRGRLTAADDMTDREWAERYGPKS